MSQQEKQKQPLGELIIQYDPNTGAMRKQLRGTPIPMVALVNFLELMKMELLLQQMGMAQQAQQQQGLVVPNGPIPNLRG